MAIDTLKDRAAITANPAPSILDLYNLIICLVCLVSL